MVLFLGTLTIPEESITMGIKASVSSVSKKEKTHCLGGQGRQTGVNQGEASCRGHNGKLSASVLCL
jgi:hypothetical protein